NLPWADGVCRGQTRHPCAHRLPGWHDRVMTDRIETQRLITASPADIFAVLCDPQGHVAIDATGMLQSADGDLVQQAGNSFVVHMDRESLGDIPDFGRYDVTVTITEFEQDALIAWTILGRVRPQIG